jgi:hypothetical protein
MDERVRRESKSRRVEESRKHQPKPRARQASSAAATRGGTRREKHEVGMRPRFSARVGTS